MTGVDLTNTLVPIRAISISDRSPNGQEERHGDGTGGYAAPRLRSVRLSLKPLTLPTRFGHESSECTSCAVGDWIGNRPTYTTGSRLRHGSAD
jgi:hypothetical protein